MTVFSVIAKEPKPDLAARIQTAYPSALQFSDQAWFISDRATAQQVCEKLNVKPGGTSGVVVVGMGAGYFGFASTNVWEWFKTTIEADRNG